MTRLIIVAILLLAGTAWAGEVKRTIDVKIYERDSLGGCTRWGTQEAIKQWAASGEICRVLGHRWDTPIIQYVYPTMPPRYGAETRKCSICGKTETKKEVWE